MAAEISAAGGGVGGIVEEEVLLPPSVVEQVLSFLRQNGFTEVEFAFKEDIMEKIELGSVDFEKFLLELPPVRIPATLRHSEVEEEPSGGGLAPGDESKSGFSSGDEFVSVVSSTSGVCSSEFINPYGLGSASQPNSDTCSSDRMSQFGTAREYPDFDMQNDLFCYHGKQEDGRLVTPFFKEPVYFDGPPSEDKFVMTSTTAELLEDTVGLYDKSEEFDTDVSANHYLDRPSLFDPATMDNDANKARSTDFYHFDPGSRPGAGGKEGGYLVYDKDPVEYVCINSKEIGLTHLLPQPRHKALVHTTNADTYDCRNGDSENGLVENCKSMSHLVPSELNYDDLGPDELSETPKELPTGPVGKEAIEDELLMYGYQDDRYEIFDLRIMHRKNRTGFEENKDLPIELNTVIGGRYCITEYLGSAAFSKVVRARDLNTGMDVCLKIIKNSKDFFDQSLDEIKLLKLVNKHDPHDERHILRLYDYFYQQEHLFIVCELLRANLYEFQKFNQESGGERYFTLSRMQFITRQCLEAMEYLHELGIIHSDLKPENILIKSYSKCEIKVIDLGSSCFRTDYLCLYVQSRSYRAPEVMLGLPYDEKIDIWSLGCILAELCSGEVLFPNDSVVMILARMVGVLGGIDIEMLENGKESDKYFTKEGDIYYINEEMDQIEYIIPEETSLEKKAGTSDEAFLDFLRRLLEMNPSRRPTASQALKHHWLSVSYDN